MCPDDDPPSEHCPPSSHCEIMSYLSIYLSITVVVVIYKSRLLSRERDSIYYFDVCTNKIHK